MKLTMMLLTVTLFSYASDGLSQSITANTRNSTVQEVISLVEKQTKLVFIYKKEILKDAPKISLVANNMPVEQFLAQAFRDQAFTWSIESQTVVLIKKTNKDPAMNLPGISIEPPIIVRGQVVDESGKPVLATITVKGTKKAVSTNENGEFEIAGVSEQATLVISGANIITFEIKVNGRTNIATVTAQLKIALMEDVVVNTGYQMIARERSAGSAARVDMATVASRSSSTNILQRLDGLVPGLVVNNTPGGEPLLIRGLTSLNSTRSPLIVVDGVELPANNTNDESLRNIFNSSNPIANINPQDIAEISVLRDASAASIWGAKAANGVIVITTKKGRAGQKLRVEYDGFYNFQGKPDRSYIPTMNSQQFIATAKELFPQYVPYNTWNTVKSLSPVAPHLQIQYNRYRGLISQEQAERSLDSLAALDNRGEIEDLFYRNAATTNHTLSLSGGGQAYSFYGSLSYTGMQSSTPGEKNNSYKVNLRQDFNFSRRLQFSLITDLTNTVTSATNLGNGISDPGVSFVPYQHFRDANGNPLPVNILGNYSDSLRMDYAARSRINLDYVPLKEFNSARSKGSNLSGRVVGSAKLVLLKGLRFEGTYGYQTFSSNNRTVWDEQSYTVRNQLLGFTQAPTMNSTPRYWLPMDGGMLTVYNASQKNWTVRNQFIFDQNWQEHQLTVMAGQEATSTTPLTSTATYYGWDDQLQISRPVNIDTLMKGISGTIPGGVRTLRDNNVGGGEGAIARTTSYYSTLAYMFQRKYALNASWRIDQSNLFGLAKSAQNRPVYSVGGKWMLHREEFMKQFNWLDRLDLRFTYGITGNAPRPAQAASFDILEGVANVNYVTGAGLSVRTPGNDKLTWEGTTVYNAGLDFAVMGGRLYGAIDAYVKKTTDLIGSLLTAPLTGYATVTGNYGDLENKGIEISLNSINVKSRDFFWNTSVNIAYNKNKITRMATASAITTGTGMILEMFERPFFEGKPAYASFAYNYGGLNGSGDPQIIQADGKLLSDKNGSKAEDVMLMGTSQPVWTGGLFNTFEYKGFQLGINISFNLGHVLFRDVNTYWMEPLYSNAMHPEFANRWRVPGDENKTNIPRYAYNSSIAEARNTTYYQYANINSFDASYAKIREITLAYSLPDNLVRLIHAEGLTFRAQVSNLMLWKANGLGIDPEFQTAAGGRMMRNGQGSFTIGAHLTL
ncbi:SusC/RagA family TonB-linked outer membrane protein [Pseudoflavitalea rhizosphaerae]|uniref:SusC/RagA family TonB-linked outer membrane protein n=1 Tax=Pseudoflavitalea rhizosphaerae TaxID=1884793 RepID=UPI0013E0944A|nr:SusC/RagA family TonB-linked outer membrane protein [Pseudoflavitalea rhizosphaerae]